MVEARFGKHQRFSEVETRFAWMLDLFDPDKLFVFGVMRDPVDYMISLYNSHTDPKFKETPGLYTAEIVTLTASWMSGPFTTVARSSSNICAFWIERVTSRQTTSSHTTSSKMA